MKKRIATFLALAMGCVFGMTAMAAEPASTSLSMSVDMSHVYIEDATLEVGDTYTWSYDGEAGPVDYGEQGTALRIVSGQGNDAGGMTFVYEAIAPGTQTFRIVNRWWTETYKTVTVTVEAAAVQEPEPPAAEPETPVEEPETPAVEPETPAEEPETPAEEPETPTEEPEKPVEEPETPTEEPETPAEKPETPVEKPEAPTGGSEVPDFKPVTPAEKPEAPAAQNNASGQETAAPNQSKPVPAATAAPVDDHGEIAQAKADGSWGAEYTTCPACGYHNWTASSLGYVCDTCGHIAATVKSDAGVKGYTAPAPAAPPASQVASAQTMAEAQAANDAYLAAIRALQEHVAQREAAYLASLGR